MGGLLTALGWEWLLEAPTFQTAAVQMPPQPARLLQPADLIPSSLPCSPPSIACHVGWSLSSILRWGGWKRRT